MFKFVAIFVACSLSRAAEPGAVEYGKYLVEQVAECGKCHTPRKATGELDGAKPLKGALLPKASPDLTSSGHLYLQWGERGMVGFLETGLDPKGHTADSHMPAYKLRPHDAEAIAAYLKSLR
jgi:mono/diheme cytochrome c family protein